MPVSVLFLRFPFTWFLEKETGKELAHQKRTRNLRTGTFSYAEIIMNIEKLLSLSEKDVSGISNPLLRAMWYDLNGNWDRAHTITQEIEGKTAARVHAYLHRKEGDQWNAEYWYRRAGVKPFTGGLDEEAEEILKELRVDT